MKTQEEILIQIENRKGDDVFGFEVHEYMDCLNFENAKQFLKEGVTEDKWLGSVKDDDEIIEQIKSYMSFAFRKAYGERGISSNRSIMHYIAWIWLIGDADFYEEIKQDFNTNYHSYGLPILNKICRKYDISTEAE